MTDGLELEAARRSEVAGSFRYARAFYEGGEATGSAAFEGNRQAIIDVIALAYRDGRASARAGESALRAAAREVVESQESLYGPCEPGCECSIPALKAALDGAPWEPSEEQVERVAIAVWRERVNEGRADKTPPEQWVPPFTWESVHPHSKEVKYYPVARAALKAAMGSVTST